MKAIQLFNKIPKIYNGIFSVSETIITPPSEKGYFCDLISFAGNQNFHAKVKLRK